MFETEQICPYTGLRSFTEEESLYFKGREEDIDQATQQLQKNKFLMLTGASGDGKSSLIYAGIIPNARSGFLKAKYTQWCVADFRPERNPFYNLCRSLARQLDIPNSHSVQAELQHGFSAIIDLYKSSKRYIDVNSVAWEKADDKGKAALKREAANLIILVDQFEEFFTNPENYHRGVPSGDANLVLNLLLETARIALEEDLPIYIVFTMRSDYIGQCAAFRGLPEYIGFSQFFVPRLNRTQLQQVIEEPAVLSGNRITRRLTERLIHDLTEGVDQLPILQHALNQIWHAAENGNEEMDLLHYAMVGGMPVDELPDEQVERFNKWFESLPIHIKACYHRPNLQNVLDTHTNKLYEQAASYYEKKTGKSIADQDAKAIIRTAFICLTKIDQSRAVRNRMTLKEITKIFGRPGFDTTEVGNVLNIFREPGNTFIRPFILEDEDSQTLKESDVLDITHESLIRNWEYLEQWAKEEFDNYTISLDFEQQLNRWVYSEKSKDFLMPIGPLTYFENWFNKAKPNAYWIARYLPEEIEQDAKLTKAKQVLGNAQEFLKRSADKHVVTRTIMKYGPKRIAAVLGLIAIIVLSSFVVRDYLHKQNDYVLKSIKEKTFEIANFPKLSPEFPVPVLTEQLINNNATIPEIIDAIKDQKQKIKIATAIATQLITQGRVQPHDEIFQSLTIADSLLEQQVAANNNQQLPELLKLIYDYSATSDYAYFLNQNDTILKLVKNNAVRSAALAKRILKDQPDGFNDIQFLNLAIENGLNKKIFTPDEINQLLNILSPFENKKRSPWVLKNYNRDKVLVRGSNAYGIRFNGLFQDLSYLYAASGQPGKIRLCMDSLLKYQENFYQNDYATHADNASNIAAVFFTYGATEYLDDFVQDYCSRKNVKTYEFYYRLVSWALSEPFQFANANFYTGGGGQIFFNSNLKVSSDEMMSFFFSKLKEETSKIKDENERNFNLAVFLKNEGIFFDYRNKIRDSENSGIDQLFDEAVSHYAQVSGSYLDQSISVVGIGADQITVSRNFLFLYPDYRTQFHPFEPRSIIQFYYSSGFIKYVLDRNLFDNLYTKTADLRAFELWFLDYHASVAAYSLSIRDFIPLSIMEQLAAKFEKNNAGQYADLNILYLHMADEAIDKNEIQKGIAYLEHIEPEKLLNAFQYKNFDFANDYSLELVSKAVAFLTINNRFDLAYRMIDVFKKEVNRSSIYGYASQLISLEKLSPDASGRLLDSAIKEMNRMDNPAAFQPNRHEVAIALIYKDPEKNANEAYRVIKNSFAKFEAIWRFSKAFAIQDKLYEAQQQMPSLISMEDKAGFLRNIYEGYNSIQPPKSEWKDFSKGLPFFMARFLVFVNEND